MTIIATCGHRLEELDQGIFAEWDSEYIEYGVGFGPSTSYGVLCKKCFESDIYQNVKKVEEAECQK